MPLSTLINRNSLRAHLICWSIFITYELLVSYSFTGNFASPFDYFGHYLLNIILFYWNGLVTMERSLNGWKRNYLLMTVLIILELAGYLAVKYLLYLLLIYLGIYPTAQLSHLSSFAVQGTWRALYFIGLSTGWWFSISRMVQREMILALEKKNLLNRMERESAEKNLMVARNMYLNAQINPHFLFNTLSFIHYEVNRVSAPAGDMLITVADMMRYALKKPEQDNLVAIEDEIEHIENFIKINRRRFKKSIFFTFSQAGNFRGVRVIPLVIMTFAENIFKYGELGDREFPAVLHLSSDHSLLKVYSRNRIGHAQHVINHGIGISNASSRLQQHYKENFLLEINANDQFYELNLTIKLI